MSWISRTFHKTIWLLSGEFFLTWPHRRANGGTIIFARCILVTLIIYSLAISLSEVLDPSKQMLFSSVALRLAIKNTLPWFAAIFAAIYAALYARFASQWTYLATLYNQIKSTQAQIAGNPKADEVIASMKAGLIEDADKLHLALKQEYASLIKVWSEDEKVRKEFIANAPGGLIRLNSLLEEINKVRQEYEDHVKKKAAIKAKEQKPSLPSGKA
jgi:hypothetical protein